MNRDPFYNEIVRRLAGRLDPDLFERAAVQLLRQHHPTLVPIRGGDDSGMDGAVADGKGEPFPLVSTTEKSVISNLTRSLDRYVGDGGTRRLAIVATSRQLNQRLRENLNKRAQEKGFTLHQIYDQSAIADRLYHSPEWCRELLNLTGDPPPLSRIPLTARILREGQLVGREEAVEWLRQGTEDRLLVGQPASGKTALLYALARDGVGLFVNSNDIGRIAEGIRAQEPTTLFLDDAHDRWELLLRLVQLRREIVASFRVIATCWPGGRDQSVGALSLGPEAVNVLEPLTRDEIVEVIRHAGIVGPANLVRQLVNQADGRPGLATYLTDLCLRGGTRDVLIGDALKRDIEVTIGRYVDREATYLIATFALGGESGLLPQTVADHLTWPLSRVIHMITNLAFAGIVSEVYGTRIAVRPLELRGVLVRDVFFRGAVSLPFERILAEANPADATATLIEAREVGAQVPDDLIRQRLLAEGSSAAYVQYAWLGVPEVTWVLTTYGLRTLRLVAPALYWTPELVIPQLFHMATGDLRPLPQNTDHPLRLLDDWVKQARPVANEPYRRRSLLLEGVGSWLDAEGDREVAMRAIPSVLYPGRQEHELDAGSGMRVTYGHGLLPLADLRAIEELWPRIVTAIRTRELPTWVPLFEAVEDWIYPQRHGRGDEVPREHLDEMRSFAGRMLRNLATLATERPGVLARINRLALGLALDIPVALDPDFTRLYPPERRREWRAEREHWEEEARLLADDWKSRGPKLLAAAMLFYEREAEIAGITYPRLAYYVCERIAHDLTTWLRHAEALLLAGTAPELVYPFLRRAVAVHELGWESLLCACLKEPKLEQVALLAGLSIVDLPADLEAALLAHAPGHAEWFEDQCACGSFPDARLGSLLQHSDDRVASAVAVGLWLREPKGTIPDPLRDVWETAVVRSSTDLRCLSSVLDADAGLAYHWLQLQVTSAVPLSPRGHRILEETLQKLGVPARRQLLDELHNLRVDPWYVQLLVGDDVKLYETLLHNQSLQPLHLEPLAGHPNADWDQWIRLALDAGYLPRKLCSAVLGNSGGWKGDESDYWREWADAIRPWLDSIDEEVRFTAHLVHQEATSRALSNECTSD